MGEPTLSTLGQKAFAEMKAVATRDSYADREIGKSFFRIQRTALGTYVCYANNRDGEYFTRVARDVFIFRLGEALILQGEPTNG